jgi:hypothetical protein
VRVANFVRRLLRLPNDRTHYGYDLSRDEARSAYIRHLGRRMVQHQRMIAEMGPNPPAPTTDDAQASSPKDCS